MRSILTVFKFAMLRSRGMLAGWAIPVFFIGFIVAPFYDLIDANVEYLTPILENLPTQLTAFMGGKNAAKFLTPEGFIAYRYFAFIPVILGIYGAIAGSGMIASDEERGVLDLILAHPAGRGAVFWGRTAALVASLVVIIVAAWLGLWAGSERAVKLDFAPGQLAIPFLSAFAIALFFVALALALSVVMPSRASAAMITGIYAFGGYIITTLAKAIPALESWARYSAHTYFQEDAMEGLSWPPLVGLLVIAVVLIVIAWFGFKDRDVRVAGDGGWRWPFFRRDMKA